MYQVKKRNGQIVNFELSKISDAISKAFAAKNVAQNSKVFVDVAPKRRFWRFR